MALDARLREREQRYQGGLRRIGRADGDPLSPQIGELAYRSVGARNHHTREIAVGVAHRDRLRPATPSARRAIGFDPCKWRVPGDVDFAAQMRLDLPLIIGVEDEIEWQPLGFEIGSKPLPDRDNLGIVGY